MVTKRITPWGHYLKAALLAAAVTVVVFLVASLRLGLPPFGTNPWCSGDCAAQYYMFHSHLKSITNGDPMAGLEFSWLVGAGMPFLSNYIYYTGGPFPLLLSLVPYAWFDTALFAMHVLMCASAAAVMAVLLTSLIERKFRNLALAMDPDGLHQWAGDRAGAGIFVVASTPDQDDLRPDYRGWARLKDWSWWKGPLGAIETSATTKTWLVSGLLAAAYGVCSWVFTLGFYNTMWLNGMVAFPLLCLVALHSLERRHFVLGTLSVALCFWANFYTAYMAALGAVWFFFTWAAATRYGWKNSLHGLIRFAAQGVLGVGINAVTLIPLFKDLAASSDFAGSHPYVLPIRSLFSMALPQGISLSNGAALYTTVIALLLVFTLPGARTWVWYFRLYWCLSTAVIILTVRSPLAVLAWSAFDTPNGNVFRYVFVLSGWLVISARLSLRDTRSRIAPSPLAAAVSVAALSFIVVFATRPPGNNLGSALYSRYILIGVAVALFVAVILTKNLLQTVLAACLAGATILEASLTGISGMRMMYKTPSLPNFGSTMTTMRSVADDTERLVGWPTHRFAVVPEESWIGGQFSEFTKFNLGALVGAPDVSFGSSLIPSAASAALVNLGFAELAGGRLLSPSYTAELGGDPALDALLAVAARTDTDRVVKLPPAFPMVRVLKSQTTKSTKPSRNFDLGPTSEIGPDEVPAPFSYRDDLLEEPVYSRAKVEINSAGVWKETQNPWWRMGPGSTVKLRITCPAGMIPQINLKSFFGQIDSVDQFHEDHLAGFAVVSTVTLPPSEGKPIPVDVTAGNRPGESPTWGVCLDQSLLTRQVEQTVTPSIQIHRSNITATFDQPMTGTAVIATAAIDGWSCQVDGEPVDLQARAGLLAAPMRGNREVSCHFTTPGVKLGAGVSVVAAVIVLGLGFALERRRRRRITPPGDM